MMPDDLDFARFLEVIDRHPELRGLRVAYFDGDSLTVVREGPLYCSVGQKMIVLRPKVPQPVLQDAPTAEANDGKMFGEVLGLGLSCSGALVSWAVVAGSGAAAPITGGTSTFLTYLSLGAATASSIQCVNAMYRVYAAHYTPEALDVLDQEGWYVKTGYVLDAISVAGAIASTAATVKLALALRRTTGKTMVDVLKGLTRQQRRALAEEAIRIENPGISNSALKVMVRAGVYPKRFAAIGVSNAVRNQLRDALGAALGYGGSALSGVVRGGWDYAVGVAGSVEDY